MPSPLKYDKGMCGEPLLLRTELTQECSFSLPLDFVTCHLRGVLPVGVTDPMMSHLPKDASEEDCRLQSKHVRYLKNL